MTTDRQRAGHGFGTQDVIDAQSSVLGKAELAVVPPGVLTCLRMKLAKHVHQAPAAHLGQGGPLIGMAHHLVTPGFGIVNVPILRRDIEIAAKNQRLPGIGVRSPARLASARSHANLYMNLSVPTACPLGT